MDSPQDTESFYYVDLAFKTLKRYWYLFTLSIIVFVACAFFINWYVQPEFEVKSVMLIDENLNNPTPDPSKEFMKSFSIFTPVSGIQMEILKMKSSELIYKALEKTHLELVYYNYTEIKTKELYDEFPFKVELIKNHIQPLKIDFEIIPQSDKQFKLISEAKNEVTQFYNFEKHTTTFNQSFYINKNYKFGDTVKSNNFSFIVHFDKEKLADFEPKSKFKFSIQDLNALSYVYQKMVNIEQVAKDIHAVSIKIRVKNPNKGIEFINALTEMYLQRNMNKKSVIAEKTIEYLDSQLGVIEDSLNTNGKNLQNFRSNNRIMEINSTSEQVFKKTKELEDQKADLENLGIYYNYINENLTKEQNGGKLLVPSSMGINDQVLTHLVDEYVRLNIERSNLSQNSDSKNPYYINLTTKINNQKNILSENLKYLINTNNLKLNTINNQLQKENSHLSQLPKTERSLQEIERKFKLNDELYNYMLKKKSEAELAKASNIADNDILEPAKLTQLKPVSPNKMINLGLALVLGFIFPFTIFGAKNLFNNTISSESKVKTITNLPSLGRIFHNKKNYKSNLFVDIEKSIVAESFRTVRDNINFYLKGKRNQVILLTSSKSGEGKSFTSMNMAICFSLLDRKTILLDFDFRKPNKYNPINLDNKNGITNFLNDTTTIQDIITPSGIVNLDYISSGQIPLNPSELINSSKVEELFLKLKETYDYIIIDTPPIGLVTETFTLMRFADLKIFVIRENVTPQKQLPIVLSEIEQRKIDNVFWLINSVDIRNSLYNKKNEYFKKG